jgi:ribosomal protein L31
MARKNIHPQMHDLEIVMPDGKKLMTKSTWHKKVLQAEVAFSEHQAWTGEGRGAISKGSERVERSNKRYGDMTILNIEE